MNSEGTPIKYIPRHKKAKEYRHDSDPPWQAHLREVLDLVNRNTPAIYVYGDAGVGKSTILNVVHNTMLDQGRGVSIAPDFPSFSSEFLGLLSQYIEQACGVLYRDEDPLVGKWEETYQRALQLLRQSGTQKPLLIFDRFYRQNPDRMKDYNYPNVIRSINDITSSGTQLLAAGRDPLDITYPELVPHFTQVHMVSKQVE